MVCYALYVRVVYKTYKSPMTYACVCIYAAASGVLVDVPRGLAGRGLAWCLPGVVLGAGVWGVVRRGVALGCIGWGDCPRGLPTLGL